MSNQLVIAKAVCWEDSGCQLMARIEGQDAASITQASLGSIDLSIYASDNTTDVADATATPVIADTVFNTLQTDARWTKAGGDSTGYNFRYASLASQVPAGGKTYRFEFKFTPTSGEPFHVVFDLDVAVIRRS